MKAAWLLPPAACLLIGAAAPASQTLTIRLEGLRSTKGKILICVTRKADHFPDCTKDPEQHHVAVRPAAGPIDLGTIVPGDYAIAIVHDENGNGKLDTFVGIPREGVGFSRNPVLRFGAPGFRSARFPIAAAPVEQTIRVKYFL